MHETHLLKFLGKMYEYEMNPTTTIGATERTCDGTDAGRADQRTHGVKPIYPHPHPTPTPTTT